MNINRDYLIILDVKSGEVDSPNIYYFNTDKNTSNLYVQMVMRETTVEATPVENALDYSIKANILKPNMVGKEVEGTLVNPEKAIYEFKLPDDCINLSGNAKIEFEVFCTVNGIEEVVTSFSTKFKVYGSILTDQNKYIEDSSDYPILKQLIEEVKELQANGGGGTGNGHTHSNKTVLDGITAIKINSWDTAYTHSQSTHFNGNYNNLTDKPIIPTNTSQLINDSGFITEGSIDFNFIDDTTTATDKTWSSNKIDLQIKDIENKVVSVTGGYAGTYTTLEAINADSNADTSKYYILTSGDNAGYTVVYNNTKLEWELGWYVGGSPGTGGSTEEGTYDIEISLPFSATSDTDVQLTLSSKNSVSFTNLCPDGIQISQYEIGTAGAPITTAEIVNDEEKGFCLYYKNSATKGYNSLKLFSSNTWDSTHYYYVSYWVKMVTQSTNYPDYPYFSSGTDLMAGADSFDRTNTTSWQRVSFITKPADYLKTGIGFNIQADGEFYFKPIAILDMEGLGYDISTEGVIISNGSKYISDLDSKVLQANNDFSCIVNNGDTTENIVPFASGIQTYYYTVSSGTILSISERSGYNMPSITAKVKSSNNVIQDNIEDVELKITTRFAGKKVVFEGDSITDSDYNPAYNGKSWADYLANKLKMTIASNMALGGSSISTYNSAGSVVNRITSNTYPSDTKLFCIMAGTNDWNSNVALGNIDSTDTSTILGALNTIIDHLQTNYPDATIVIMTPMHRSGMRTAIRNAGTLSDVAEAYEKVCMNWGVNCINTLKEFGINAYNTTVANKFYVEQDSDWLHPNPAGHKRIAVRMAGYISTL